MSSGKELDPLPLALASADDAGSKDEPGSSPDISEVDSAWDEDEFDEDATMVARVPHNLVALSRLKDPEKNTPPREEAEPEKHEAITARPPPPQEPSVVVDAPHEQLADVDNSRDIPDEELDENDGEISEGDEEARARAADEAAGLDAEARRKAVEERAALRRDRSRAKKIAARDKRKEKVDAQRSKQKKPKKRSVPPPPPARTAGEEAKAKAPPSDPPTSREQPTLPPTPRPKSLAVPGRRRDLLRMALLVALVVIGGALIIGLMRRP